MAQPSVKLHSRRFDTLDHRSAPPGRPVATLGTTLEVISSLFHVKSVLCHIYHVHTAILTFQTPLLCPCLHFTFASLSSSGLTLHAFLTLSHHFKKPCLYLLNPPHQTVTLLVNLYTLKHLICLNQFKTFGSLSYSPFLSHQLCPSPLSFYLFLSLCTY